MPPRADSKAMSIDQLRKWLHPTDYLSPGNEYMKHLQSYIPGTGDWLRESDTFRKWEDGTEKGCLWVRGIPGSGKSVFAASTVKTLAETQDASGKTSPVLFFFFRQIVEKNHDPKYLVRDWIAQLLPFSTRLRQQIEELSKKGENVDSPALWDALVHALGRLKKVYCVADALDEMDDQHAFFIDKLRLLGAQDPARIKVMITSRPIPQIEAQLRYPTVESVRLEPMQIYPDIVSYVCTRLESLRPRLGRDRETLVQEAICDRSGGLFLYARLSMDSLTEGLQEGSIIENTLPTSLAQLPMNLTELYTKMLQEHSRRSGVTMEQQFLILQCVTQSSRPMRLIELGSVIAVLTKETGADLKEGKILVRQACGRLLEILEDESVSVIHHSFTEFARDQSRHTQPGDFPVLDEKKAQTILVQACLQYLDSCQLPESLQMTVEARLKQEEVLANGGLLTRHEKSKDDGSDEFDDEEFSELLKAKTNQEIQELRSSYPFMLYSAENLMHHLEKAEAGEVFGLMDLYFVPGKNAFEIWLLVMWHQYRCINLQPLHIAASFGLTAYTRHLLPSCSAIDSRDGEGRTALLYAAGTGQLEITSLLLSHGANPVADDRDGHMPLHVARSLEVARLLLAAGANPMARKTKATPGQKCYYFGSDISETALKYACQRENTEILSEFVEYLDVDDACRCLLLAVRSRKLNAVEIILKTAKAPIDALVDGVSALAVAAKLFDPALIKLLLEYGADVNQRIECDHWPDETTMEAKITFKGQSGDGPTALHVLAGYQGSTELRGDRERGAECVKLLIEAGSDVNAISLDDQTSLHYAVQMRRLMVDEREPEYTEEIMTDLLLQYGANPNARCKSGTTPLHKVSPERLGILEMLLQNGADLNARDKNHSTPLLSMLAKPTRVTSFSSRDNEGETKEHAVLKLLELGADMAVENEAGVTIFHQMFYRIDLFPKLLLWKTLINAGVDLNKPNKYGKPPVSSMTGSFSRSFNMDLLKLLVDEGLQLNSPYLSGTSFIFELLDVSSMNVEAVQKYLDLGCSADARDQNGATLLHHCVRAAGWSLKGFPEIFDFLVNAGADPVAVDTYGNNLFHELALRNPGNNFELDVMALTDMGVCSDTKNKAGRTPLHIASAIEAESSDRSKEFLDSLLDGKLCTASNVNLRDNLGASPLHYAASLSEYNVGRLVKAGADPTLKTNKGLTPLHLAARGRQSTVICLLLSEYRKHGGCQFLIDASDDSGRTALHYACRSRRPESVRQLLSAGANFLLRDEAGRTPLHALVESLMAEQEEKDSIQASSGVVESFPDRACVLPGNFERPQPDYSYYTKPSDPEFLRTKDIIEMFEEAGADLETTCQVDGHDYAMIDLAVRAKCTELVNELRNRGYTAQDKDAEALIPKTGDIKNAKALLELAEPTRQGDHEDLIDLRTRHRHYCEKFTAVLKSFDYNLFNESMKLGGDLKARPIDEWSIGLRILVEWGYVGLLEEYFDHSARISDQCTQGEGSPGSLLHYACAQSLPRLDVIKLLVEKVKIDVNQYCYDENAYFGQGSIPTALHRLSTGHHFWNLEAIEYLLDHGADIEVKNDHGETPLMTAMSATYQEGFWREEVVRVLLDRGANVNSLNNDGNSCLSMSDHANITRMLLLHGADVKVDKSSFVKTAIPTMDVDIARLLLEAGFRPDEDGLLHEAARSIVLENKIDCSFVQRQKAMIFLLLEHNASPFMFLDDGSSVLQRVIEENGVVDPFWNLSDFRVELVGEGGRTPLISACYPTIMPAHPTQWRCKDNDPKPTYNPAAAQVLLEKKANVRATDNLGRTALHWICTHREIPDESHKKLITAFVARSPDIIHQKDVEGLIPLQLALADSHAHDWITEFLVSCGSDYNVPDPTGSTALHYLAPQLLGEKENALAAAESLKKFHSYGLPIDQRNNLGETPLFCFISTSWVASEDPHDINNHTYATENDISHAKALFLFLEARADLRTRNDLGETLLHVTAKRWRGKDLWEIGREQRADMLEIFNKLMELGLDPRAEDASCQTSIDVAVSSSNMFLVDLFKPKETEVVRAVVVEDTEDEEDENTE